MMTAKRITPVALVTLLAAAMTLSACAQQGDPTSPTPSASPSEQPPPVPSPVPIDETALIAIDTVATSPDGAQLALAVRVHASLPADDPEVAEERAALERACPDFVTAERLDGDRWGLVRIDVVAQQIGDAVWPADVAVPLATAPRGEPGAAAVAVSGDPLQVEEDPAGELGPCLVAPSVTGVGSASTVLGIRYDFASPDAQGLFWNAYRYGLTGLAFGTGTGIEFSECSILRTALADELAAPEIGYSEAAEMSECSAGIPSVT